MAMAFGIKLENCFILRQAVFCLISIFLLDAKAGVMCSQLFLNDSSVNQQFFSQQSALKISMRSNFSKLMAGRSTKKNYPVEVVLPDGSKLSGTAKAFGDSSLNSEEAPFRKLKLNLKDQNENKIELYVNTHLDRSDFPKWSPEGRILDGTSPFREAIVYDLAKVVGVQTGFYRRASIEYQNADTGEVMTEQAVILENFADTAKRLDAKLVSSSALDSRKSLSAKSEPNVAVPEAIRAQLLQILIGNTDYNLEIYNTHAGRTFYYNDYKNVALLRRDIKKDLLPIVYDFDIASIVVGHEVSAASKAWEHLPEITSDPVTMVMLKKLLQLRTLVKPAELQLQIDFYKSKKHELLKTSSMAMADQVGRELAVNHVEHFFAAIEMMNQSDFQFLQSSKVLFTRVPGQTNTNLLKRNAAQDRPGRLREGTPFVVLGEEGGYLKILMIDIYNDLQEYNQRIGYIPKATKFSNVIDETAIPYFDSRSLFQ